MKKIFLLLIFASLILVNFASAELVCCEKTISGDTCQYVDNSQCDASGKSAPTNCVFTSFCKPGCCFNLNDGRCYANMPLASCVNTEGNSFGDEPTCNLPQCDVGCCIIGNEASLITQTRCKKETSNYPDLQMVFKENIKDEAECVALARSSEKGCCVVNSDSCTYTTRANCELKTGTDEGAPGFFKDRYCSDQELICDCVSHQKKGCLPGSDDVYWFDSCGNPEDVAQDCDYVNEQTTCGVDSNENYKCLDLSCKAEYDLSYLTDSGKLSRWKSEGNVIKNGESWCEYDTDLVGFGRDVPGSRYYRGVCINNKILVEACKDYREEFCISSSVEIEGEEFMEAACRLNRWEDCNAQTDRVECLNTDVRDCAWTVNGCVPFVPPGSKFWEGEAECSQGDSSCVVTFKTGGISKLLGENSVLGGVLAKAGTIVNSASLGTLNEIAQGWECIDGCDCLTHDYLVKKMNKCRSIGDCGADYNIEIKNNLGIMRGLKIDRGDDGKLPSILKSAIDKVSNGELEDTITYSDLNNYKGAGQSASDAKELNQQQTIVDTALRGYLARAFIHGIYGLPAGTNLKSLDSLKGGAKGFGEAAFKSFYDEQAEGGSTWKQVWNFISPKLNTGSVCETPLKDQISKKNKELGENAVLSKEEVNKLSGSELNEVAKGLGIDPSSYITGTCNPSTTKLFSALNTFFSVYSALSLVDAMMAETQTVDITTTCKDWQAPTGSLDCELCNPKDGNDRENKLCSEYTCKSFGQSCELVNEGTGNESCVTQNPHDVNSPIITMWDDAIKSYQISKTPTGYKYNSPINAFTIFPMAIKTDEPAQCMMALEDIPYEEMTTSFGTSLFTYDHLSLTTFPSQLNISEEGRLEIIPGKSYTVYIKCQDSLENQNEKPFTISFTIKAGPDTTSPVIEGSSISSGSYVKQGINQTDITIYVNEPSECKWSRTDQEFEDMEGTLSCTTNKVNDVGLFECTTKVSPIIDQVLNIFYFRCKDQPGADENDRNVNAQSFVLKLRGSVPLVFNYIEPNGEIYTRNFTLEVGTSKGATLDGRAYCYYDTTGSGSLNINSMVQFLDTNSSVHKQVLAPVRREEPYNFSVICVDYGSNMINASTSIIMKQDLTRPYVKRIYKDESYTPSHLKVILNEPADCEYRNDGEFSFGDGIAMNYDSTEHDAAFVEGATYYIMCMDNSDNLMIHIFHA